MMMMKHKTIGSMYRSMVCCHSKNTGVGGMGGRHVTTRASLPRDVVEHDQQVLRRPTYDDVQRLSEGKASSSSRGWGSRQVCHRLNAEERKAYTLATTTRGFLTIKGSGYRKERKGSPLANIYRQYCDAGGVPCVNVMLISSGGGKRREDFVLVDMSPTRRWCTTPGGSVIIHPDVEREITDAVLACCAENAWTVIDHDGMKYTDGAVRRMGDAELREVVPWTILTPLMDYEVEETLEHVSTAPMWQIPPCVVGYACPDRSQAKLVAKALVSTERNHHSSSSG